MAKQKYVLYKVSVGANGTPQSQLTLYEDSYGTPDATGTVLGSWTGAGPNLTAVLIDGVYRPNKTSWTETLSGNSGPLDVEVSGAGTGAAVIRLTYGGADLAFDASSLELAQSASYPAYFTYNQNEIIVSPLSGDYTSSLTSATALGPDSLRIVGVLDPAADRYVLRWRPTSDPSAEPTTSNLAGTTAEVFPVVIVGLAPSTSYTFDILSIGAHGESTSSAITGTTSAPTQLSAPAITVSSTESASVKQLVIGNVTGAGTFKIQIAPGSNFSDAGVIELTATNRSGATVLISEWPESSRSLYSIRVKSIAANANYADSSWSEDETVSVDTDAEPEADTAEIPLYSNIRLLAVPSDDNHLITVAKAEAMIDEALSDFETVVTSIGGLSGTVTITQLYNAAVTDGKIVQHSTTANPNVNNLSVITSSSTDSQIPSAKAVYHYVNNTKNSLNSLISSHYHTYLYTPDGSALLSAPGLEEDGTIVADVALADTFDSATTYQDGAVVSSEGFLYKNTSGGTSQGNRDFQRKWTKVTVAELVSGSSPAPTGGAARYETDFYGADLDANHQIVITHNLDQQFVVVQLVDISTGSGNPVIGAQTELTSANTATLTLSSALPAASHIKVIVLG